MEVHQKTKKNRTINKDIFISFFFHLFLFQLIQFFSVSTKRITPNCSERSILESTQDVAGCRKMSSSNNSRMFPKLSEIRYTKVCLDECSWTFHLVQDLFEVFRSFIANNINTYHYQKIQIMEFIFINKGSVPFAGSL